MVCVLKIVVKWGDPLRRRRLGVERAKRGVTHKGGGKCNEVLRPPKPVEKAGRKIIGFIN